ncbi:hypothetical protein RFI_14171 [Reticulomyxa filosa]|uniref:Uncharacterized protein n=1 Tax=Reticulomyxa filosa TaxID=46433 RepID=X6NB78_RETFI|nr:hypothetical protein RFI_14171 [Reticulomyxa filosa]|eukprot:ETO23014.1 hypothetical protein RFI_14171 [Reticulomyxa filosa]
MLTQNEQGLIMVAYDTSKRQDATSNLSKSFLELVEKSKAERRHFRECCVYVIKGKLIVLQDVDVDGNVYAVNCQLQCKGKVVITVQLFATKDAIIDEQFKRIITPIQWNTKIHHDFSIRLQEYADKAEQCSGYDTSDIAIFYLYKFLRLSVYTFGFRHHYVAIAYNLLGRVYDDIKEYDKAIEFYQKALDILLRIFGASCTFVAQLHNNLAHIYYNKGHFEKSIQYNETALKIRLDVVGVMHYHVADSYNINSMLRKSITNQKKIFKNPNVDVADSYWNLGLAFELSEQNQTAYDAYSGAWKMYSLAQGEWNNETIQAKQKLMVLDRVLSDHS